MALLNAKLGEGLYSTGNVKIKIVLIVEVSNDLLVFKNINLAGKICNRLVNGSFDCCYLSR